MINFKKIEDKLDRILDAETPESMTKWLKNKRKPTDTELKKAMSRSSSKGISAILNK